LDQESALTMLLRHKLNNNEILSKVLAPLKKCMADLPEETIVIIFTLQRRLLKIINEATKYAFMILEQYGAIVPDLEILENVRERTKSYYTRLSRLLLQVFESQPMATSATLELLIQSIAQVQASADANEATVSEVKRDWNLS
jgi:hypothetical protein